MLRRLLTPSMVNAGPLFPKRGAWAFFSFSVGATWCLKAVTTKLGSQFGVVPPAKLANVSSERSFLVSNVSRGLSLHELKPLNGAGQD